MVVLVLTLVVSSLTSGAVAGERARLPKRCQGARLARESAPPRDAVPVLFVHGFLGSPGSFQRTADRGPSMLDAVSAVDGVASYTFDYAKHASEWVTDPAIGPALARALRCLADVSGHKVVVIAHSMGGLAARLAQGQLIDGRPVSESIARVVTIGTPTRGVLLLSSSTSSFSTKVIQTLVNATGKACDDPPKPSRKRLCALLDAANAPATTSMAPGSGALAALPAWGPGVRVHPIAGDLRLRVSVFGLGTTTSLGDVVATVSSATADPSRGEHPLVVRCHIGVTTLDTIVDRSPCAHGNLTSNRRIIAAVRTQVVKAVRAEDRRRPVA